MTTSAAVSGDPPEVYLGAAGELVTSSLDSRASFYESRAGGRAWAPAETLASTSASASVACVTVDAGAEAKPPRGITLPPRCGCCGSATALVMQIHAPLPPLLPDRALLFFACVLGGEKCSRRSDSWIGIRVQGPPAKAEEATAAAAAATATAMATATATAPPPPPLPPVSAAATDSWGLEGSGGGAWGIGDGEKEDRNIETKKIDFSELATELAAAAGDLREQQQQQKGDKSSSGKAKKQANNEGDEDKKEEPTKAPLRLWTQPAAAGPTLPSFYVSWSLEADAEKKKKKSSNKDIDDENAHVAELLARYEASEGRFNLHSSSPSTSTSSTTTATTAAAAAAAAAASRSTSVTEEALASSRTAESFGWSGEGYEPDSAPGASPAFLAFAKKLSKSPEQVARYYSSRNPGKTSSPVPSPPSPPPPPPRLLWPEEEGPPLPPPPCPRCGSQRQYEAQLMAPLVALLDEAGQWEEEEEEEDEEDEDGEEERGGIRRKRGREGAPALRRAPESWEWLTVAMATCLAGCGWRNGENDVFAVEEAVAVAFE